MARQTIEGCEPCTQLGPADRVHPAMSEEPAVPEHLVDSAKAIFSKRRSRRTRKALPAAPASLVFVNNNAVAAGSRSLLDASVQAVYHSGDYAVDLQIEPETEANEMALIGQVVRRNEPSEPLAGIPVLVKAGNKEVAESQSNRFGEFCLVVRTQRDLTLCLDIEEAGNRVEIPLTQFMTGRQ